MTALKWAVFDGTPDETIDEDLQMWALHALQEFWYRREFHLTKEQMAEEPLEDIAINSKIIYLINIKQEQESKIAEQRAKSSAQK